MIRFNCALLAILLLPLFRLVAQEPLRSDTLTGVVLDDKERALAGATVIVTALPTTTSISVTTNVAGGFAVAISRAGASGYLVVVRAPGFVDTRRSVLLDSADVALRFVLQRSTSATLRPIQVQANRVRPPRSAGFDGGLGPIALQSPISGGVRGILAPIDEASIEQLVGIFPGVFNGGLGAFGLGAEQTLVTINGMPADASTPLPLGLATSVQINTLATSGALGGAAGSNINISVAPGSAFHYSSAHAMYDGSPLQRVSSTNLSNGARMAFSLAGHGPIGGSRWRYNGAVSGDVTRTRAHGILEAGDDALESLGLTSSALRGFTNVLQDVGETFDAVEASTGSRTLSGLVRIDRLSSGNREDLRSRQWSFTVQGSDSRDDPSVSLFASASTGSRTARGSAQAIARISEYIGPQHSWLHESQLSIRASSSRLSPVRLASRASVRVESAIGEESNVRTLAFGGGGTNPSSDSERRVDLQSRLVRSWARGRLESITMDLFASGETSRDDGIMQSPGNIHYHSAADVAAGTPSRYTRVISQHRTQWSSGVGGAALTGKLWPTPKSNILAILRTEAELVRSSNDALTESSRSTTQSAMQLTASPRLTYTYYDNVRPRGDDPARSFIPFMVLHQGATWQHGEYTRMWSVSLARQRGSLHNSLQSIGNNETLATLDCVGANVPVMPADAWFSTDQLPLLCADGSTGQSVLRESRSLAPTFAAPATWEATLARERSLPLIGGTIRLAIARRVTTEITTLQDRNQTVVPRFLDADGRAMLADPSAIDATSGSIALSASRIDADRGRELTVGNEGWQTLTRLTFDYVPSYNVLQRLRSSLQFRYSLQDGVRRGDGSGVLSSLQPNLLQSTRLSIPMHQVSVQMARQLGSFSLGANVFVSSGRRFTPMVANDVNGDGWTNDVAFTTDEGIRSEIRALQSRVPNGVEGCLDQVVRSATSVNSCTSAWSVSTAMSLFYLRPLPVGERTVRLSIHLANPVALADQLMHGSTNLRGWGTTAVPDPYLLSVKSFDPTSRKFMYAVNPRFGQSSPARSAQWSPFRITISARVDLADPLPAQQIQEFVSVRRNGVREAAPATTIEERLKNEYDLSSPYFGVLARLDSVRLDAQQFRVVRDNDETFRARTDSLVSSLAKDMASGKVRGTGLIARRDAALNAHQIWYRTELKVIGALLRADQIAKLNDRLQRLIREAHAN